MDFTALVAAADAGFEPLNSTTKARRAKRIPGRPRPGFFRRTTVVRENDLYIAKLLLALRRAERSTVLRYRDESFSGEALLTLICRYAQV